MEHSWNDAPCPACGDLDGCHLPARERAACLTLDQFWVVLAKWSQETFGTDAERGPVGPRLCPNTSKWQSVLRQVRGFWGRRAYQLGRPGLADDVSGLGVHDPV